MFKVKNSLFTLVFFFSGINETQVNEMCFPGSKIDPQIVQSISWLPLVSQLCYHLYPYLQKVMTFVLLLGKPDSIYCRSFFRAWTFTLADYGRNISTRG